MDVASLWTLGKPIIQNQISIAAAAVGGTLVTAGAIHSSDQSAFVEMATGAAMWAIPAAWSWWNEVGKNKLLARMAKMHPVASPTATTAEAVKAAENAGVK